MLPGGVLIVDSPGFLASTGLGFPIPSKSLSKEPRMLSSSWHWRPSGATPECGCLGISENPTFSGMVLYQRLARS